MWLAASLTLLLVCGATGDKADPFVVSTKYGKVLGMLKDESRAFLGVPFAMAPVGSYRFAAPRPWTKAYPAGVWDATFPRPACLQNLGQVQFEISEDCLYLEIHTPLTAKPVSQLPVMVFFFGGSFTDGAGSVPTYDGAHLAANNDVVVVSINYRVGAFGFAAFDAGDALDGHPANFGLLDQREALRWAQGSIASFGGDPARVMIFGESAGAVSVQLHMLMSASAGLFSSALSESGLPTAEPMWLTRNLTQKLGSYVSCPTGARSCLLKAKGSDLLAAEKKMGISEAHVMTHAVFSPTIDGVEFLEHPASLTRQEKFPSLNVTFVGGTNTNESNLFIFGSFPVHMDAKQYKGYVHEMLVAAGGNGNSTAVDAILKEYPASEVGDNRATCSAMNTDCSFLTGTRFFANHYAAAQARAGQKESTYLYRFNHKPNVYVPELGIPHMSELSFVWNNGVLPQYEAFSKTLGKYWTSLARTGDPNYAGSFPWPKYDAGKQETIVLDEPLSVEAQWRSEQIAFWSSIPPYAP